MHFRSYSNAYISQYPHQVSSREIFTQYPHSLILYVLGHPHLKTHNVCLANFSHAHSFHLTK